MPSAIERSPPDAVFPSGLGMPIRLDLRPLPGRQHGDVAHDLVDVEVAPERLELDLDPPDAVVVSVPAGGPATDEPADGPVGEPVG
jgi:hypothetical protein